MVDIVNKDFRPQPEADMVEGGGEELPRLIPRTEGLEMYALDEFNDKVMMLLCRSSIRGAAVHVSVM